MNKNIKDDAEKLINFFCTYSLKNIFDNDEFMINYKTVHKNALGYMVIFSEIEKQNKQNIIFDEKSIFYLKESVSDVLQSVFAWVNGAYKGADLLLRSSIENFNKSIIGNSNISVYEEKSVYKIFEILDEMPQYKIVVSNETFSSTLHRIYAELCKSTHTATSADMDHVTALNLLPKYEEKKSKEYVKIFVTLIDTYLGYFLANHKEIINKMFITNKDIVYDVLPKSIIQDIIKNN